MTRRILIALAALAAWPATAAAHISAHVTNPYMPLPLGASWTYQGTEGGEPASERVEVLRRHRRIAGVRVTIVRDRVWESGELTERTFDWYAQNRRGDVLYMGEWSTDVQTGSHEGSWRAGHHGARAGVIMPAHPAAGYHAFAEHAPPVALDEYLIARTDARVRTPGYSAPSGVVRTYEWTQLEPGISETKLYAPHVGLVKARSFGLEAGDVLELSAYHLP
jgi:hypothetical protein